MVLWGDQDFAGRLRKILALTLAMDLGWNHEEIYPNETMHVMDDGEIWPLDLELLRPQP